jgi:hypothetical protein
MLNHTRMVLKSTLSLIFIGSLALTFHVIPAKADVDQKPVDDLKRTGFFHSIGLE